MLLVNGIVGTGKRKWSHSCTSGHLNFAHLPVHSFGGTPGYCHFIGYARPHVCFESVEVSAMLDKSIVKAGATFHTRCDRRTSRTTGRAYSYDLHPTHSVFQDSSGNEDDS